MFQPGHSFGKFYLVQLIGEGGTSRIFKALQQPIDRLVALKIPSFAEDGSILTPDEFLSEATLMARLEHGHVVRIYDFGVQEDRAFICMEYVEGWNLQELVLTRGPFPVPAVLAAGVQTLDGLLYAHAQGVLHLDLSPANVLVAKSGTAKLSDFGMAGKKAGASQGRIVGTPAFLSPEHVAGVPGTAASDLFGFASLLYYLATGAHLFDPGEGNFQVTRALGEIRTARENPPLERIRRLPPLLAGPILTALQGRDAEGLMREVREAWRKAEPEGSPEAALRRELDLGNDAAAAIAPWEELPSGTDLRDLYFRLREGGRHREAVALLEKALRRQPDNPLLQELLATPPAKAKSAPATVLVAKGPPGSGNLAVPGSPPSGSRKALKYLAGAASILAVTLGFMAGRGPRPEAGPIDAERKPADSVRETRATAAAGASAAGKPGRSVPMEVDAAPRGESRARLPAPAPARRGPKPPALSLSGPAGTRVNVDDTAEWISPGPAGGWLLRPGLVNITLTAPGSARPITSSLFVSADTLYLLTLDAEGGFSLSRRGR